MGKQKTITATLMIITVVYSITASAHFGGNLFPESDAEVISDGLKSILWALTVVSFSIKDK